MPDSAQSISAPHWRNDYEISQDAVFMFSPFGIFHCRLEQQHFCNSLVICAWLKVAQIATADVISAKKGRICASKRDFDAPWDSEKLVGRPK